MITAREIAAKVGVSISTVGRALSDDPRISRETKDKVRRAADQAGYVGNMPARIVRGGASNLVGLILPDVRNDFYAAIAQALSETCDREGHRLVLSIAGDDRDVEARHIRELTGARAAGIIVVPTASPRKESVQMLRGMHHVQLLRRVPSIGGAWFGIDDQSALRGATHHLVDLGHQRIAYVGGRDTLSTGAARLSGFREALAGLEGVEAMEEVGPPTADFGAAAIERLMARPDRPTAIVTGSVHITLGIVQAVEKLGIAVPADLSLVGFGDPQWCQWWRGGMTTIRPPVQELATTCGLWFLHQLRSRQAHAGVEHSATVTSTLILRATTTAP